MIGEKWKARLEEVGKLLDGLILDGLDEEEGFGEEEEYFGVTEGIAHLHSELVTAGVIEMPEAQETQKAEPEPEPQETAPEPEPTLEAEESEDGVGPGGL